MIVDNISINPYAVTAQTHLFVKLREDLPQFPLITIDRDSYIVNAQVQSGLNFDIQSGIHSIQIGRYCSFADRITFMVNLNHDYSAVTTGEASFLRGISIPSRIPKKGQILIQNDVWVGHGATLMGGITLHNGAVIAANAVVTKDVPPYAIVGGNPAKVIRYRFEEQQMEAMEKIAWWYWDDAKIARNKMSFSLQIHEFIALHLEEAERERKAPTINIEKNKPTYLFFPDFDEPHPVYERVIRSYCAAFGENPDVRLLLYLKEDVNTDKNIAGLEELLKSCYSGKGDILVHVDRLTEEGPLFSVVDYYITTRAFDTVKRTCLAMQRGVKSISGVDEPIFRG